MLNHPTYQQLNQLRLFGMAKALNEQQRLPELDRMSFEERLGLLVEREASERASMQTTARLRRARLKHAAAPEEVDYRVARGLDRTLFNRLLTGSWIKEHQNVLITGLTGLGKTWLACALTHQACRLGYSSLYVRVPRLFEELAIAHGDGRYVKFITQLSKVDVLLLDDWGVAMLTDCARRDLLEILDDRYNQRSTIITSQLKVDDWHDSIGDPILADAILDRVVHNAHKLDLSGESIRKSKKGLTEPANQE